MGLKDLFKNKKEEKNKNEKKSEILLAMPIFKNKETYEIGKILENLKTLWGFTVNIGEKVSDEMAVFEVDGQTVAIANMSAPVPWNEIEEAASYNYLWPNASEELKDHTSHAIVTILSNNDSNLNRYFMLSKILSSILLTSNCSGIYQGSQTLLISKENYLNELENLKNNKVPVPLWVYIGLRNTQKDATSLYTYGMTGFDKKEMEIIDSKMDANELYDFLLSISSYVIEKDVTLNDGETIGYTADMKIAIKQSKGVALEGETLKLKI